MRSSARTTPSTLLTLVSDPSYVAAALSILVWYFANVSTVILNKYIYVFLDFKFPLTLTAVHMLVCAVGSWLVTSIPWFGLPMDRVELRYWLLRICPLAFLFCVNIILGNVSLRYIPVSFMQTIKSSVPACTVLFQWTLLRERVPAPVALSLIPIVGGVMLATYTEVNFHPIGFWAAVLASFATAGSAILNGIVLTTKLNPMSLVFYMAPPSLALLLPLIWAQERDALVTHFASGQADARVPSVLIISGLIAFLLNLSSFWVIKRTSPLTFTVAGNFKVVLSIVFSVMIFRNEIGPLNSLGCLTAILGVAYYNQLRFRINQEAQRLKATQQQQQQQQQQLQVQQSSSVQSTAIDLAAADAVSPNLMEKLADKV